MCDPVFPSDRIAKNLHAKFIIMYCKFQHKWYMNRKIMPPVYTNYDIKIPEINWYKHTLEIRPVRNIRTRILVHFQL